MASVSTTDIQDIRQDAGPSRTSSSTLQTGYSATARTLKRLHFPAAAQPEIIRANQKDSYYLADLAERIEDVTRGIMGSRWVQTWSEELHQASQFAYFLTTLLGSQTLGEEYCDIMQFSVGTGNVPSARHRATLAVGQVFAPYALSKLYARVNEGMVSTEVDDTEIPRWSRRIVKSFLNIVKTTSSFLVGDNLRMAHLAIFYLVGHYYDLGKRITGIRYFSTQSRRPGTGSTPPSYEILGAIMIIQLWIRLTRSILSRRKQLLDTEVSGVVVSKPDAVAVTTGSRCLVDGHLASTHTFDPDDPSPQEDAEVATPYAFISEGDINLSDTSDIEDDTHDHTARRCTLCLAPRKDPTSADCGHVFCWECIIGWGREKPECPLCRQSITLSGLVPLYNLY